jgi:hypothetical protein
MAWGAGGPPRRPHGRRPPAALAPRDGGHAPPEPHLHHPPLPRNPREPPYKASPVSIPLIRRCRLGISPCPPQEERRRGGEGEAGGEGTGGRPWESPKPSRRWTTRSPPGLQARPPDGERPCVDREGAGVVQVAGDRPFTEPNPLLPLHRAVRLPRSEPRRARFCILCSASAPLLRPVTTSPLPAGARGEHRKPLYLAVAPDLRAADAFEPCELAVCLLPAGYSRHCADPSSLESQPSSRAGRFAGAAAVVTARARLPCSCVVP